LASAGGKVVTKDELMERVWAGVVVEEHNIQVHISALRRALAEDGNGESRIVTVSGRGYRFLGSPDPPAADITAAEPSAPVAEQPSLVVLPFLNLAAIPSRSISPTVWSRRSLRCRQLCRFLDAGNNEGVGTLT
jgi:DNA-binding winged helix-turn-helix (wHTH) protein